MPESARLAVAAWNMMGAQIDWAGLPVVCELLGIEDVPRLVTEMLAIRDFQNRTTHG